MKTLVQRLSKGMHPVEVSLRPERTVQALKECIDRGFVHVKFTETRGGTELGFAIDTQRSVTANADFVAGTGVLTLVGQLTLDYVRVNCIADIRLPDLNGEGRLECVAAEAGS